MNIKDVEEITGLDRSSIRFYEKEGFIFPSREENSYRNYSERDVDILKKIRFLRNLGVTLEEIHTLIGKKSSLEEIMYRHADMIKEEQPEINKRETACKELAISHVSFESLDIDKYNVDDNPDFTEKGQKITVKDWEKYGYDYVHKAYCPFRRYFARMLDYALCNMLWMLILSVFRVSFINRGFWLGTLDRLVSVVLMITVCAIFIHFTGTTLGKAILGITVKGKDGKKLSIVRSFKREWEVFFLGQGLFIPIFSQVRQIMSFSFCVNHKELPWDENCDCSVKDMNAFRVIGYVSALIVIFFALLCGVLSETLPTHRGDNITMEEFVDNVRYYQKTIFKSDYYSITDDGRWIETPADPNIASVNLTPYIEPECTYTIENGYITGVTYITEISDYDNLVDANYYGDMLCALALCCASKDCTIFSKTYYTISDFIGDATGSENIYLEENGYIITMKFFKNGYGTTYNGFAPFEEKNHIRIEFSIIKEDLAA